MYTKYLIQSKAIERNNVIQKIRVTSHFAGWLERRLQDHQKALVEKSRVREKGEHRKRESERRKRGRRKLKKRKK